MLTKIAASNVGQSRVDTRKNRKRNANRYENLVETDTEVHEISVHAQVEKAVSDALKNVKTSDATKGTKSKSNGDNLPLDIGRIIAQVISAIEPGTGHNGDRSKTATTKTATTKTATNPKRRLTKTATILNGDIRGQNGDKSSRNGDKSSRNGDTQWSKRRHTLVKTATNQNGDTNK